MTVLIKCDTCGESFWVRGDSPRPNEYGAHEEADLSECCQHIQDGGGFEPIDCEVDDCEGL